MELSARFVPLSILRERNLLNLNELNMNFTRIENFDVLFKEAKNSTDKACVILHGYGASFNDLAPLHQFLDKEENFNWYFVDGPFNVDIGMGMMGKAWFPIDMMKLQMLIQAGKFEEVFYDHSPHGLHEVSESIISLLKSLKEKHSEIILGGFSQGSMVSTSVAMMEPSLIEALVLMSSTVYDRERFEENADQFKDMPIFQSHGLFDPVLPFNMAQKLYEILSEKTDDISFESFEGGHEIPAGVLDKASSFLRRFI